MNFIVNCLKNPEIITIPKVLYTIAVLFLTAISQQYSIGSSELPTPIVIGLLLYIPVSIGVDILLHYVGKFTGIAYFRFRTFHTRTPRGKVLAALTQATIWANIVLRGLTFDSLESLTASPWVSLSLGLASLTSFFTLFITVNKMILIYKSLKK